MDFDRIKDIFFYFIFPVFYVFLTVYSTKFVQGWVLVALTIFALGSTGFDLITNKKTFGKEVILILICYFAVILYVLYLFGIISLS